MNRARTDSRIAVSGFLLLLFVTMFGLLGCESIGTLNDLVPAAPIPPSLPSAISNLQISPSAIPTNQEVAITFEFQYTDVNGDVGPDITTVVLQYFSDDPRANIDSSPHKVAGEVEWANSHGKLGRVSFQRSVKAVGTVSISVGVRVKLIDKDGNESNTLIGSFSVVANKRATVGERPPALDMP